jgi:hypothetical protein
MGSCLLLKVDGSGTFDNIKATALGSSGMTVKAGEVAQSTMLPINIRIPAPPGVNTSSITALRVDGYAKGVLAVTGSTDMGFSWPDGMHSEAQVTLAPVPPGPYLSWTEEAAPAGVNNQLFDVWIDPSGDPVVAVGENGTFLSRTGGMWKAESLSVGMTASLVDGAFGFPGGAVFAAGQQPYGVWRRDPGGSTWIADQMGINTTGKGFWCVTSGQNPGEIWAGDNDGKVWHRTGSMTSGGTWTSEPALPGGIGVYAIAYADGAVFAVGDAGNVAVRKDSAAGTPWVQTKITGNFTSFDWFNGVWAFDRSTAVAVGTNGTLIRYQNGQWDATALKIDPVNNSEMTAVWGLNSSRVWVASKNGAVLRVDGATTYRLYQKPGVPLQSIFGLSETNIYAVGGNANQPSFIVHGAP